MSQSTWPKGLVTALVTPMKDDSIDTAATKELVDRQVAARVAGVAVAGGTGEHGALTSTEREELTRTVASALDGRLPFIVQTGALTTAEAVRLSEGAQEIGAAGLLVPAPYGESVNWREKLAYYQDVNASVSVPIMLYNTSTAGLLNLEQIQELAELSNVSAVKQSSPDATALGDILAWSKASDFVVYTGWDDQLAPAVIAGAHGALLGAGNVVPESIVGVLEFCYRRELGTEFENAWARLRPFLRLIGNSENYVSAVKLASRLQGIDVGDVRRPYLMPDDAESAALTEALSGLK